MNKYNSYYVHHNNKKLYLSFEKYILYNHWTNKNFIESFNKNCWENIENQGADVSDYIKKYIRIKLIPLKKNSSVTMISKMKKKNIDSSKYLNDIWSKDKLIVWYLDNDIKLMLLKIREKNLNFNYKFDINKKGKYYSFSKNAINKLDEYSKLHLEYLNNKILHNKLEKNPSYLKNFDEKFIKHKYPNDNTVNGYIAKSNTLYLILPPKPTKFNIKNLIDSQLDVLYNLDGNVTIVWSNDSGKIVKNLRLKLKI